MPPNILPPASRQVSGRSARYSRVRRQVMKTTTVDLMGLVMLVLVAFFVVGVLLV